MKRMKVCLLLVSIALVFAGCKAGNAATPIDTPYPPSAETIDFGNVTILCGNTQAQNNTTLQSSILSKVSSKILHDKSVSMNFSVIYTPDSVEWLKKAIAAGTPPDIALSIPKKVGSSQTNTTTDKYSSVPAKVLNKALDKYGYTIKKTIPAYIWDQVSIHDLIMQIPQIKSSYSVPVINQQVLDKYNWTMPSSPKQFEDLLGRAKNESIAPIATFSTFESSLNWFGVNPKRDIVNENGIYTSLYSTTGYISWLNQQKDWYQKGWLVQDDEVIGDPAESSTWLCQEMLIDQVGRTDNITVLPNFSQNSYSNSYIIKNSFESYHRPETLVIFFDWVLSTQANNLMISLGEENQDYKRVGDNEYELIHDPVWVPSLFLLNPITTSIHERYINEAAYSEGRKQYFSAEQDGGAGKFYLPSGAIQYRKEKSRLDRAYNQEFEAHQIAFDASNQYIRGGIDINQYNKLMGTVNTLLKDYIQLLQDKAAGHYNIWDDVYLPSGEE